MTRLKFSAVPLLALAILAAPAAADPRSAANALFDDPVEREAFFAMMAADPALTAAVAKAESSGDVKSSPDAAAWRKNVLEQLTKTRTALAAGIKQNPPATDYPAAPLVAPLLKGLKKQNAADLYVSIGVTLAKHDAAAHPPASPQPCTAAGARKALEQARVAAGTGDMSAVTGDCQTAAPSVVQTATTVKDPKDVLTPPGQVPAAVTDQRTTTGAPPAPGEDKDKAGGGSGGFFSNLPLSQIGLGAGFGGMLGLAMGFGTPVGIIGGALIGAVCGAVLFSGVIGKLFGGGKSS